MTTRRGLLAMAAILALTLPAAAASARTDLRGRVEAVRATDTLVVKLNGRAQQVRLIGIVPPARKACYGGTALAWMRRAALSRTATLTLDPNSAVRDRAGRLRAYAQVAGVGDLGEALVRAGLARVGSGSFVRRNRYAAAEQDALVHAAGIWSACPVELPGNPPQRENPPADVAVTILSEPATVTAGNVAVFTAQVRNLGMGPAESVTLRFTIPSGVDLVSAGYPPPPPGFPPEASSQQTGPCTGSTPVTCTLGPVQGRATTNSFGIPIQVRLRPSAMGDLTVRVEASSRSRDTTSANNAATAAATVRAGTPSSDLSLTVEGPAHGAVGDHLVYEVRVGNNGPTEATGVVLSDFTPSGPASGGDVDFPTSSPADPFRCGPGGCRIGAIVPGTIFTLRVHVVPHEIGTYTMRPRVSSETPDPTPSSNTAATVTTVGPPTAVADLGVAVTWTPERARAGEPMTLSATVRNAGPDTAQAVRLALYHAPARQVSSATDHGSCRAAEATLACELGALAPGEGARVDLVLRPGADPGLGAYAFAYSTTFDPSLLSQAQPNTAEADIIVGAPTTPSFVIEEDEWLGDLAIRYARVPNALSAFGAPTRRGLAGRFGESCFVTWARYGLQLHAYLRPRDDPEAVDPCQDGTVNDALVTGSRWRTATGLAIGDPETNLDRLYPDAGRQGAWRRLATRRLDLAGETTYPTLLAKVVDGRVTAFRLNTAGVDDIPPVPPPGD
jgi:uncharacterized repeat protein (TIGR01451 family)